MTKPRRLFDCIEDQMEKGPINALLVAKEGGKWREYSLAQVKDIVEKLAAGLLALGISSNDMSIEGRDKVAILSKNRPEWIFLDLAVQMIGAVLVPVYPTVHTNDLQFVLNDSGAKLVFVNDDDLNQKVQSILHNTPSVKEVYTFEKVTDAKHWKEILPLGQQEHYQKLTTEAEKINTEDLFTIIYTSGTTGTPKGVMLSHHNVLSNVMSTLPELQLSRGMRVLSFLPLNHIFERTATYIYLFSGVSVHYAESLETLGDNLREVKPHMFTTVPRLLEKVFERILAKAQALTGVKKKLFYWALGLAEKYDVREKKSIGYQMQMAVANKVIFSKWREGLGNNVKYVVTGSAACPVRMIRLFTAAGIPVLEGYGLTETSPVISFNRIDPKDRMFGTVGPVINGVEVKIAEDGEILCKGPNIMMGYYKRDDLTAEAIIEGWFHTGDIGTIVENRFLKITDRKKEIFKTLGGKFVAPQPIENKMAESPFIEQIMVVGASKKFTGALIVPSFLVLKQWCKEKNIAFTDSNDIIKNKEVLQHYRNILNDFNANFNPVEQIKKFELLPSEWTIDTGELTPNLKMKRKVIHEKYKDIIEHIYE